MERGQVTIPKKYRERYDISEDTEVDFVPKENGLLIVKKTSANTPFREIYGILKKHSRTDPYIKRVKGS